MSIAPDFIARRYA